MIKVASWRLTFLALAVSGAVTGQELRLERSLSGPSGRVQGSAFLLDEVRARFVYPQDKALVVYFEWRAQPGLHVLSAQWKGPDGRTSSISPEVKVETTTNTLAAYWNYTIDPEMEPGIWTVEIRVDGRPGGQHTFEIAGTKVPSAPAPPQPKRPTLDEIFRAVSPSVVFVRKLDGAGKRWDTSLGFVFAKDRLATAFQSLDGAASLEIEWADGRKTVTDDVLGVSRLGDWAVLPVDTGAIQPIPVGEGKDIRVGQRLILFTVDGDVRTIGGIDIAGRRTIPAYGERIQFSPSIGMAAAGGPLLDRDGKVVAIVGGSVMPGGRFDGRQMSVNPSIGLNPTMVGAATPLPLATAPLDAPSKLAALEASGVMTPALSYLESFVYATTAADAPKSASAPLPRDVAEFSRRDPQIWVVGEWQKKGKISKGMLSGKIYDAHNRSRIAVPAKKLSLSADAPTRSIFGFAPGGLEPGLYRIDLIWDDRPVWRTLIRIVE